MQEWTNATPSFTAAAAAPEKDTLKSTCCGSITAVSSSQRHPLLHPPNDTPPQDALDSRQLNTRMQVPSLHAALWWLQERQPLLLLLLVPITLL